MMLKPAGGVGSVILPRPTRRRPSARLWPEGSIGEIIAKRQSLRSYDDSMIVGVYGEGIIHDAVGIL